MSFPNWGEIKTWGKESVWTYPLVLLVIVLLLTAFKINGSSVAIYDDVLNGANAPNSNLLFNKPQTVRSDEWLVNTQLLVGQVKSGMHKINPLADAGQGSDLSIHYDLPAKTWSTIFKPHDWSYFIMPLANAFAFHWWIVAYILIVSCYFFCLRVLGKKPLSILLSLAFSLSPFFLWWYKSDVLLEVGCCFLILLLCMRLLNKEKVKFVESQRWSDALHVLALIYVAVWFGVALYPPFQISVAIVVLGFLVGYFLHKRYGDDIPYKQLLKRVGLIAIAAVVAAGIAGAFIMSNRSAIDSLNGTVYPGKRIVQAGDLRPINVFDSFLMPLLQINHRALHFFTNQSEASNFILLLPFLILPCLALIIYEYKKRHKVDFVFLFIQLTGLLFFARAFVPYGSSLYNVLLLERVQNTRLVIGMGFLGIIQIIYLIKKLGELKIGFKKLAPFALAYSLICFLGLMWMGDVVRIHYPMFVHSWLIIGVLGLGFVLIMLAFLVNKPFIGAILLLLFSAASCFHIMPLYRGLGFAGGNNAVTRAMDKVSGPHDSWATVDNIYYESLGMLAGRPTLTGDQLYPDVKLWQQIGKQYNEVYNREGHVLVTTDPTLTKPVKLVAPDFFELKLTCNSNFLNKYAQFYVSTVPLYGYSCLKPVGTVPYPATIFYLYKNTNG